MIAATLMVKIAADSTAFTSALAQAQRATRASAQQMEFAASAVTQLQNRMTNLSQGYRLGVISAERYADGLKEVRADMAQLAATSELSAKSQERLAGVGAQITRQLNMVTTAAKRSAEGVELFGITTLAATQMATGGIASVGTAVSSLGVLARGNPWLIGIMTGLSALAAAWSLISSAADKAKASVIGFTHAHREAAAGRLATVQQLLKDAPARVAGPSDRYGGSEMIVNPMIALLRAEEARLLVEVNTLPVTKGIADQHKRSTNELERARAILADMLAMQKRTATGAANVAAVRADALAAMTQGVGRVRGHSAADVLARRPVTPESVAMPPLSMALPVANLKKSLDPMTKQLQDFKAQTINLAGEISSGIVAIASAAGQGFKNMGNVLLSILGGLMITVGRSMISFGLATKAIGQLIKNPVLAIAAGATLVALGSALSSSAQGAVSAATGGGGGGGGASSGGGGFSGSSAGVGGNAGGTVVIHGQPRDVIQLDDLAAMLRELGYRDIQWMPA